MNLHRQEDVAISQLTKIYRVEVWPKSAEYDPRGRAVMAEAREIGIDSISDVRSVAVTFLQARLDQETVRGLVRQLLVDPVIEEFAVVEGMDSLTDSGPAIEVHYLPGVMDPVALSTFKVGQEVLEHLHHTNGAATAMTEHGPPGGLQEVRTARRYRISGEVSDAELERIAKQILANSCIQAYYLHGSARQDSLPKRFPVPPQVAFELRTIALREKNVDELTRMSRELHLFLSLTEMQAIQAHFRELQRDPTDLELETLAQTWSEHCVHKTLKSEVVYRGAPMGAGFGVQGSGDSEEIVEIHYENLLKDTIVRATKTVNRPWCLSVFVDNAGIISFDDEYGVAFKVETHNHPSAIEPYGGAATGVGGCVRDIMGCGLGAKPIANTDVFCLAPPNWNEARLPQGVLHPRRVLRGVVAGVRDYGNCMGIPTVNGAFYFDERYLANPLVFCGCIGLIPRNRIDKRAHPGDLIVVAGGRTGRDGIHGATFSSSELTDTHADEFSHAVQIGNPIEEKKVLDALLIARDHPSGCLFSAVTDCGAGGLSSAVGEMGAELGAEVDLDRVPLKYSGLRYDEIWISEAQERMVFAVPPDRIEAFQKAMADEEVEATVIGRFTGDAKLRTRFAGKIVGELGMDFLHHGLPKPKRAAHWTPASHRSNRLTARFTPSSPCPTGSDELHRRLLTELSSWNVASKEATIRVYDHEVQGGSVIKPLVGPGMGPSDAAVLRPRLDSQRGVVVGCGLCPDLFDDDPYWMAVGAIDEAVRNVVCVGADLDHTALLDNFCWGGCNDELSMGTLVRTCQGAHDAAVAYGLPFISGKDSLNNQFSQSGEEAARTGLPERWAIPGTLLVSAISVIPDVRRCITADFKRPGSRIVLAGANARRDGLPIGNRLHRRVEEWIRGGSVLAAHDISDGGLLTALAEMCIAGRLGAQLDSFIFDNKSGHELFLSWMPAYLLEVGSDWIRGESDREMDIAAIGRVVAEPTLTVGGGGGSVQVRWSLADLDHAWRGR